jgi:hypothetical protein
MALLPLDADQLLTTTRAVRKRLDFSRTVEDSIADFLGERMGDAPALILACNVGTDFKPAVRPATDSIIHWDTW